MFPMQDTFAQAAKTALENNMNLYLTLTGKTLESVEKLVTLNMTAVKASMEESSAAARQVLTAQNPQEFMALVGAQAKPTLAKAMAYNGHLANIASSTQAEFAKATEEQFAQASRRMTELVDEAAKNAPPGSENVVALVKTAFGNASAGYEQINKTAKQAVQAFETNLTSVTNQFNPAGTQAAG
ncbi:TIGR01841 family phasin [Noviherbaspirillum saxi]|uniref:Phasin family protein n=1 Tax=Noviherbaspirillum saxi TaxID=2320863 RepID=A0A3A3FR22_9BURK|nr:TIGR01841 family phasin [Noviherbaspirillum saxi]RJF96189.1 phasin family protein [Noviherbaspirillum saxi]